MQLENCIEFLAIKSLKLLFVVVFVVNQAIDLTHKQRLKRNYAGNGDE